MVARLAASRAEQAAAGQWTYTAYLADLLAAEVAVLQVRSHTQMARLPFQKTLDDFDFRFQPSLDEHQVRQLLTLQWVDAVDNLLVLGPPWGRQNASVGSHGRASHSQTYPRLLYHHSGPGGHP
ncbi:MAG: ATP-binding protein [Firmicutes bacterium]|nr:ATP-binding protein [Bacillota bacterium]